MFALLQFCPLEAINGDYGEGDDGGVNVIAIDVSRERLERFAADYEQRYRTALKELDAWDECSDEVYVNKSGELEDTHSVTGGLFHKTRWQIVEVWGQRGPGDEQADEEKIAA